MNALEVFISGLRKGAAIGVRFMLPALIAAFVVIEMLQVSGVLRLLAEHVSGVMPYSGFPVRLLPSSLPLGQVPPAPSAWSLA